MSKANNIDIMSEVGDSFGVEQKEKEPGTECYDGMESHEPPFVHWGFLHNFDWNSPPPDPITRKKTMPDTIESVPVQGKGGMEKEMETEKRMSDTMEPAQVHGKGGKEMVLEVEKKESGTIPTQVQQKSRREKGKSKKDTSSDTIPNQVHRKSSRKKETPTEKTASDTKPTQAHRNSHRKKKSNKHDHHRHDQDGRRRYKKKRTKSEPFYSPTPLQHEPIRGKKERSHSMSTAMRPSTPPSVTIPRPEKYEYLHGSKGTPILCTSAIRDHTTNDMIAAINSRLASTTLKDNKHVLEEHAAASWSTTPPDVCVNAEYLVDKNTACQDMRQAPAPAPPEPAPLIWAMSRQGFR